MRPSVSRFAIAGRLAFALAAGVALLSGPAIAQISGGFVLSPLIAHPTAMSAAQINAAMASARPMVQTVDPTAAAAPARAPVASESADEPGAMMISPGYAGRPVRSMIDEAQYRALVEAAPSTAAGDTSIGEQNYGMGLFNSPYHYNDYLLSPGPRYAPYRSIGWLNFQASDGLWYWCTATLIQRAILVTAGHCVFDGGANSDTGFNLDGWFYPGYSAADGASQRFGRCHVERWGTTSDWYATGNLNGGYDIGIALCGRVQDARWNYVNNHLPGGRLGYLAFCYLNCRPPYWFNSQFGYPGNYYSGGEMTVSQHIEITRQPVPNWTSVNGLDFIYGTGMQGGSSGGPHISNVGDISDSSPDQGQYTARNVVMAVTSWGFTGTEFKIQGASPLSGVGNSSHFRGLFNAMCRASRHAYGNWSCALLP